MLKRITAVLLTIGTAALLLVFPGAAPASAANASLTCTGITGDSASTFGDSKTTLDQLAAISGGGSGLTLDVATNATVPAVVEAGSAPFNASFIFDITLPDSVIGPAKTLLGLSSITVTNASYTVVASGAGTGTLSGSNPSQTINLNTNPVKVTQSLSGTVTPTGGGAIFYRPGAIRLTIGINTSVSGIRVDAITVTCGSSSVLATTTVQVPGAPRVSPPEFTLDVFAGAVTGLKLTDKGYFTPDDGNPVLNDSLKIVGQPTHGTAAVGGGGLFFVAPIRAGVYTATLEICAPERPVPGTPGVTEVQHLNWGEIYGNKPFNAHPLGMTLTFDGQETAPIQLSFNDTLFGRMPTPLDPNQDPGNFQRLTSYFLYPSAATIDAALEKLPNIGAGGVAVTGGGRTGYDITFAGPLALKDVPLIEMGQWITHLPADGLSAVVGQLGGAAGGGAGGGTPVPTQDELNAQLLSGQIDLGQYFEGVGKRLQADLIAGIDTNAALDAIGQLFPKAPEVEVTTPGDDFVPDSTTGPLCSPFNVTFRVWWTPEQLKFINALFGWG